MAQYIYNVYEQSEAGEKLSISSFHGFTSLKKAIAYMDEEVERAIKWVRERYPELNDNWKDGRRAYYTKKDRSKEADGRGTWDVMMEYQEFYRLPNSYDKEEIFTYETKCFIVRTKVAN